MHLDKSSIYLLIKDLYINYPSLLVCFGCFLYNSMRKKYELTNKHNKQESKAYDYT